jgi:alpha,alpha-trehalose-phosphate synthase [UDP-forming]
LVNKPSGGIGMTTATPSQQKLIVVSNRLPRSGAGAGGLVTALEPVLRRCRGLWLGWDGGHSQGWIPPPRELGYRLAPVSLREREVEHYYHGFSNRTLWPLCHLRLDLTEIRQDFWHAYERVNQKFAEIIWAEADASTLTWVHDYHLMLVPGLLRGLGHEGPSCFFLHIPFPPYEIFRTLPWRRELLEGLLGADVVAFHTPGYCENFLDSVRKILGCPVDESGVRYRGRRVKVRAAPISIDTAAFERLASLPQTARRVERLSRGLAGSQVILGVDRLDYTKGCLERLAAVERLLERHPGWRHRLVFIQVAVPTRTRLEHYRLLKRRIDEMVGRINGRFSVGSWVPVRYLYRFVPHDMLCAYYQLADVALVTPLRDGMNLVAKEYVACRTDGGGALVLSEFAGAAEELEGAILVNPHDIEGVADALHAALLMDAAEKRRRMAAMRAHLREHHVGRWASGLLADLERPRLRSAELPFRQGLEKAVPAPVSAQ